MENDVRCPRCGHHQTIRELNEGDVARCNNCHRTLFSLRSYRIYRALAFSLAAIIAWIASMILPFLAVNKVGLSHDIYIIDTITALSNPTFIILGLLIALFIVLVPLIWLILCAFFTLIYTFKHYIPKRFGPLLRFTALLRPWAMAEIFFVGVMVATVKLTEIVNLVYGIGFWSLIALSLLIALSQINFCLSTLWYRTR